MGAHFLAVGALLEVCPRPFAASAPWFGGGNTVHLANKMKCFGLIGDDDVDRAALLLNFCQLTTEHDDMSKAGYPCVVESFGGIRVFFGHHLTPIFAKVFEEGLYRLVGIAKVVFIELLDVLLLNAVDDALYTYVGDGLLKIECLLKVLRVRLEAEEFTLGSVNFDGWVDQWWLNEQAGGQSNGPACDGSLVDIIENQCQ